MAWTALHRRRTFWAAAAGTLIAAISNVAHCAVVLTINQQGSDVVANGSGTVNLSGLSASFSGNSGFTAVSGANGYAVLGPVAQAFDSVTFYDGVTGPANFGTSGYTVASSGSGDRFGIDAVNYSGAGTARLWISPTYVTGTALSATDTWTNATLASLGLTPGVYNYSWGSGANADGLQVRIGAAAVVSAVPEPATWALMLTGVGAIGATARRRRKQGWAAT